MQNTPSSETSDPLGIGPMCKARAYRVNDGPDERSNRRYRSRWHCRDRSASRVGNQEPASYLHIPHRAPRALQPPIHNIFSL
jgi:hypothetical protein